MEQQKELDMFFYLIKETKNELCSKNCIEFARDERNLNDRKFNIIARNLKNSNFINSVTDYVFAEFKPFGFYEYQIENRKEEGIEEKIDAYELLKKYCKTVGGDLSPYFHEGVVIYLNEIKKKFKENFEKYKFHEEAAESFAEGFPEFLLLFSYGDGVWRKIVLNYMFWVFEKLKPNLEKELKEINEKYRKEKDATRASFYLIATGFGFLKFFEKLRPIFVDIFVKAHEGRGIADEFKKLIEETNLELVKARSYEEYAEKERELNRKKFDFIRNNLYMAKALWEIVLGEETYYIRFIRDKFYDLLQDYRNREIGKEALWEKARNILSGKEELWKFGDLSPSFFSGEVEYRKMVEQVVHEKHMEVIGKEGIYEGAVANSFIWRFPEAKLLYIYGSKEEKMVVHNAVGYVARLFWERNRERFEDFDYEIRGTIEKVKEETGREPSRLFNNFAIEYTYGPMFYQDLEELRGDLLHSIENRL